MEADSSDQLRTRFTQPLNVEQCKPHPYHTSGELRRHGASVPSATELRQHHPNQTGRSDTAMRVRMVQILVDASADVGHTHVGHF